MSWFNIGNLSDISDKYPTNFGHKSGEIWLGERQIKAVMHVKEKGEITNKEYQELTRVSRQMATIDLSQLVERGILVRIGKAGAGIAYELPKLPNKRLIID